MNDEELKEHGLQHLRDAVALVEHKARMRGAHDRDVQAFHGSCPRQESDLRTRFRKPVLYPLSYGGRGPEAGLQKTWSNARGRQHPARKSSR
jgi:hypothetical protein